MDDRHDDEGWSYGRQKLISIPIPGVRVGRGDRASDRRDDSAVLYETRTGASGVCESNQCSAAAISRRTRRQCDALLDRAVASATAALLLVNITIHFFGVVAARAASDIDGRTGPFLLWLSSTGLARWINESETVFGYSGVLFLHTLGLAMAVGASVVVDLRMLGAASRISIAALLPVFRFMWIGFIVNALSGAMLFAADAPRKAANPLFEFKLVLIAVGIALMATMERSLLKSQSGVALAGSERRLTRLAIASLLIWTAAIVVGRLVAYTF